MTHITGNPYKTPETYESVCDECGASFHASTSQCAYALLWGHQYRKHGNLDHLDYKDVFPNESDSPDNGCTKE
jgi:hypothetical protein